MLQSIIPQISVSCHENNHKAKFVLLVKTNVTPIEFLRLYYLDMHIYTACNVFTASTASAVTGSLERECSLVEEFLRIDYCDVRPFCNAHIEQVYLFCFLLN